MDRLGLFFTIADRVMVDMFYRTVMFFLLGWSLQYVFCAIAIFKLMRRRKMKFSFLAFVPIVNSTYALGSVSDSINANYHNKTFSRFVVLMLSIIQICVAFFFFYFVLSKLQMFSVGKIIDFFSGETVWLGYEALDYLFANTFDVCFVFGCLIMWLLTMIINLICLFKLYYNIFLEYGAGLHKFLIFISVFGFFVARLVFLPDVLVLLVSGKQSRFEKLNSSKNYI